MWDVGVDVRCLVLVSLPPSSINPPLPHSLSLSLFLSPPVFLVVQRTREPRIWRAWSKKRTSSSRRQVSRA